MFSTRPSWREIGVLLHPAVVTGFREVEVTCAACEAFISLKPNLMSYNESTFYCYIDWNALLFLIYSPSLPYLSSKNAFVYLTFNNYINVCCAFLCDLNLNLFICTFFHSELFVVFLFITFLSSSYHMCSSEDCLVRLLFAMEGKGAGPS